MRFGILWLCVCIYLKSTISVCGSRIRNAMIHSGNVPLSFLSMSETHRKRLSASMTSAALQLNAVSGTNKISLKPTEVPIEDVKIVKETPSALSAYGNIDSETPTTFLPDPLDVAKEALQNMESSVAKIPAIITGTPQEMLETANRLKHGLAVSGSYAALTGLTGVKPTENNENGEYRRVTQVPSLVYNLTKQFLHRSKNILPDILVTPQDLELKAELKNLDNSIQTILLNERELHEDTKDISRQRNFILSELDNPSAKGQLGVGVGVYQNAEIAREKANLFEEGSQKNFFTPLHDRDALIGVLENSYQWMPRVGRTYKTAIVPFGAHYRRDIKKRSFSELLDKNRPLEQYKQFFKHQMLPVRPERMDTI